ncbi:MAG TPA: hemolysin family protein [Actinomycetota bacterium]|nr:hemolysin family protein [Actinomycetota bacterium]
MTALLGSLLVVLLAASCLLTMAEAALGRVSRLRAAALQDEGRRNAAALVRIEEDPPRYLNPIYFALVLSQTGSAILVAIAADRQFGSWGLTAAAVLFTVGYFLLVEAMCRTHAVLHAEPVALALAPTVLAVARLLRLPTRGLIGIANVVLPGKGLKAGPFVSEEDILSMAEAGSEEGAIEEEEKVLIESIFEFGDTLVREIMVPRPDMVVVEAHKPLRKAMDLSIKHGFSRIPVYDKEPDNVVGIVYAKDLFKATRRNGEDKTVERVMRKPVFVPETKPVSELLREMQGSRTHMAIVVDEYGDVAGLVTLEDVLEEIVGEIIDEFDVDEPALVPVRNGTWRVKAKMAIWELNELLDLELSTEEEWTTVGGLMAAQLGKLPEEGNSVTYDGLRLKAEKVTGRRIGTVLVTRVEPDGDG